MVKTRKIFLRVVSVLAGFLLVTTGGAQDLFLYEPFDYPGGEGLNAQADWDGTAPAAGLQALNGDGLGDNGTSSLEVPGLSSQGGRVRSTARNNGSASILLPAPVTGEGSVLYVSFLYKPITVGNSYFAHNHTPTSVQSQLGRWDSRRDNDPNTTFAARWRDSSTRVLENPPGHPPGTTVFLVARTTLVPDIDNDTFDLWVDPMPGAAESEPTVTATSLAGAGNDINPDLGILGFSLRVSNSTGDFEIDELRMGSTWESVTRADVGLVCAATRTLSPAFFLPTETVTVTLTATNISGATTLTDTFPADWVVADSGGGQVNGNTIAFQLDADGQASYRLTAPADFCGTAEISGRISGAGGCDRDIAGAAALVCAGTDGIRIEGDGWARYSDIGAAATPPLVVTTTDGARSLYFPGPDDNAGFVHYTVDVRQLPAGKTRFPVQVIGRNIGGQNETGIGIRNLTIDSEPDPVFQNSFVSIPLSVRNRGRARDERWLGGVEGEDPDGSGSVSRVPDPTDSTVEVPPLRAQTVEATLELEPGLNVLRIDATDPEDLPDFMPDQNWQIFRLVIGPNEPDLLGELATVCSAVRAISPASYLPGDTVSVRLTAWNISGATTITETLPDGWTVSDPGGGQVAGNTLRFDLQADGEILYELTVPAASCQDTEISGAVAGAGCSTPVTGASALACAGPGGIRIGGADWESLVDVGGEGDPPTPVTTDDGKTALLVPGPDTNRSFVTYQLDVTSLPAGLDRFPVQILARNVGGQNTTSLGIRNLSIDPEPDPALQASFLAVRLDAGGDDGMARDERWEGLIEGEDPVGTVGSVARADTPTTSTLAVPLLEVRTVAATLRLREGENLLRIDATDPADLPAFMPDPGWQIFRLVIGPDEEELTGRIVGGEPLFRRADSNALGSLDITDGIFLLNFLFLGGPPPPCQDAADANDTGVLDITTAVYIFNFLFLGGPPPPAPGHTDCGADETPDNLGCETYDRC